MCLGSRYSLPTSYTTCVEAANCPLNYYGSPLTKVCVLAIDCPENYNFADPSTKMCTNFCSGQLFGNNVTKMCDVLASCPTDSFGDATTKTCVAAGNCSANLLFSDASTRLCTMNCAGATYGDPTTRQCQSQCSVNLLANPLNKKCESICPSPNYFNDSSARTCVTSCPITNNN